MRYFSAKLLKKVDTGEVDALNNSIYSLEETKVNNCRTTEWTAEDVNIYGRDVTANARKVIVKPYGGAIDDVSQIDIQGKVYDVEKVVDLGRWIYFIVKGFKL